MSGRNPYGNRGNIFIPGTRARGKETPAEITARMKREIECRRKDFEAQAAKAKAEALLKLTDEELWAEIRKRGGP